MVSEQLVECVFFSSRRLHTRLQGDWSSDVCSSDLLSCVGGVLSCSLSRGNYIVGVLVPRSGENARLGELIVRGASLAQEDANRDLFPSGHKLVVKFRDTEGRPSLARDQFLAFVEIDHVPVV